MLTRRKEISYGSRGCELLLQPALHLRSVRHRRRILTMSPNIQQQSIPHIGEMPLGALFRDLRYYAIFMVDPLGFITEWTEGAHHVFGYASDEVIGKHFS